MTILESIVLGAVQGITEFLPISSSAHLIVVPWFFNVSEANVDGLTYDVMLHFGSLLALLVVYAGRLYGVIVEGVESLRSGRFRESLLLKLIVGTLPAVVAGLLFKHVIEAYLRTPYVAIATLTAVSLLMFTAERIHVQRREVLPYPRPDHRYCPGSGPHAGHIQKRHHHHHGIARRAAPR